MDIELILSMYEDDYNPSSMVPGPRNMYAGGVATPKRGLVDGPGSYGGLGSGLKKGDTKGVSRPVKSFADQGVYTITEFSKLNNQPFTEQTLRQGIALKSKNIINGLKAAGIEILPKTKAGQATRLKMINSTKSMSKLVDYAMDLPKPPKSLSQPFYNEIPKAFNQLVKEGNPFSQADVAKRVLSNLEDSPYKPSAKAFEEVVGKNLTKLQKKKLTSGKITRALEETAPKRIVFEQILEGNTNIKQLAKASGLSQKEVQKAAQNIVSGIYEAKKNIGLKQDIRDVVLKDYNIDDYKTALDAIRDESTLKVEYRKGIKDAVFEAYGNPNSKTYSKKNYERSLKRLDAFFEIRDKINEAFPDGRFNMQLDHPLSAAAIRNLDNITPDQLVRVSPLTDEINLGVKKAFDERYQTILKNLKGEGGRRGTLDLDSKNLIKQKAKIELLAKELGIPMGKVSLTGRPVKFGTPEIIKKNFAKEIKEGLGVKNKIIENIKKIPNLAERFQEVFGTNKSRALELIQNLEKSEDLQDVLKFIGPLLRKGKGLGKALSADASNFLNQISDAVIAPVAAAEVVPESLKDNNLVQEDLTDYATNLGKQKEEPGGPYELTAAVTPIVMKYGKSVARSVMNLMNRAGLPMAQALYLVLDPASAAYILPFTHQSASASGVYKKGKGPIQKATRYINRLALNPTSAKTVLKGISRGSIPAAVGMATHDLAKASKPKYYIHPKTQEPTFYKREKAADVLPTMIDMYEQASKISTDEGISYNEALNKINPEKFYRLNEKDGGRAGFTGGGIASLTRTTPPESEGGITSLNVKKR